MIHLLSKEQMQNADAAAMNDFLVPSAVLMENAAHSAANHILEMYPPSKNRKSMAIFCGAGNNGGDGFAMARHLAPHYNVFVFRIGDKEKMTPETRTNLEICEKLGIYTKFVEDSESEERTVNFNADIIVEATIGIGAGDKIRGQIVRLLQHINAAPGIKIAVDMPAGLDPDTGKAHTDAFRADTTITMFSPKKGMYLGAGPELSGTIRIASLGVPKAIADELSNTRIIEECDLPRLLPGRKSASSKFNYGRILAIGGCRKMPGSIAMTANAAISSGAGLVEMMSTEIHPALLPELMPTPLKADEEGFIAEENLDTIFESADRATAIAVGPGMGNYEGGKKIVRSLIEKYKDDKYIIVDADALRAIDCDAELTPRVILTPHIGEFARCFNLSVRDVAENSEELAKNTAKSLNCTVLVKHVPTVITDGRTTYLNIGGNPGMATAGSGDVLTGVIAALTALRDNPLVATALGAYFHSEAGDMCAEDFGEAGVTASRLIQYLDIRSEANRI